MGEGRLLVLATLATSEARSPMAVSIMNNMPTPIVVHCRSNNEGDLGLRFVNVGNTYDFTVPGVFVTGKRYGGTFGTTGKPTTTFWVFVGWGGVENKPCGCQGDVCRWVVNNNGFSCNNNAYSHPWGS